MINELINLLKASGCDAWEITDRKEKGWEFYFIQHQLDQSRAKEVRTIKVKVYKTLEEGKMLGSAEANLSDSMTLQEMTKVIDNLIYQATLVKNPFYKLNRPSSLAGPGSDAKSEVFQVVSRELICDDFIRTMKEIQPETDPEGVRTWVNSYEIFVSEVCRRYLNSEGIDLTDIHPDSMIEVVVNAAKGEHEIEISRMFTSGTCDREKLKADVYKAMAYGKDRLKALPTPKINGIPVVFSTVENVELMEYFKDRLTAQYKYMGYSDWELQAPIAMGVKGDKVTLSLKKSLPNSSQNYDYDMEGARIRDLTILKENVPQSFFGRRQYAQYIGLENSFHTENFQVEGGRYSEKELRTGAFLEAVEFSDFQVDPATGDIAGEIRLGYYHHDGQVEVVTGGSVSGTMANAIEEMYLSAETLQYDYARVPSVIRIHGLNVTGI